MINITYRRQLQNFLICQCFQNVRTLNQLAIQESKELVPKPEYPPILDTSFKARKQKEKADWYEQIKKLPTVEEKMIKINMPRYYGYKVFKLSDDTLPYNCLPAIQHYTRTLFEPLNDSANDSPKSVENVIDEKRMDALVESVKGAVLEAVECSNEFFKSKETSFTDCSPAEKEREFTQILVEQVHRAIYRGLLDDCPHLHTADIDFKPRHEAFWSVGGINPPKNVVKAIKGRKWETDLANEPVNRLMQYRAFPYLAMRHRYQLKPWKTEEEYTQLDLAKEIPRYDYDPRTLGYLTGYQHVTNIPGYWPGSSSNFGLLSYQSRTILHNRPISYGKDDEKLALHAQAIQSSYAWLMAQAAYNGFNTFNEITYPMNTQTIITNGQLWSFYEYQLNTLLVHSDNIDKNPLVNFCRGTNELQLYKGFDEKGHCIDFNSDVIRFLVQFYCNEPSIKRTLDELQPYLDSHIKRAANYEDDDKREFLEKTFKHLMANRPRHLEIPEIYLWEKIYKIDHNTRPMDAKRRFFEVHVNPWKRTLDQHQKEYIPKPERPNGPKSPKKWKPTYYP